MQRDELISFFIEQRLLQEKLRDPDKFCLPIDDLVPHFDLLIVNQLSRIDNIIKQLASGENMPSVAINDYCYDYGNQETCLYDIFVKFMTVEFFHLIQFPKLPNHLNLNVLEMDTASVDTNIPQMKPETKKSPESQTQDAAQTRRYPKRHKEHKALEIKAESKLPRVNTSKVNAEIRAKNAIYAAKCRKKRGEIEKESREKLPELIRANRNLRFEIKELHKQKERIVSKLMVKYALVPEEAGAAAVVPVAASSYSKFFTKTSRVESGNHGSIGIYTI